MIAALRHTLSSAWSWIKRAALWLVRKSPLISAIFICSVFAGIIAGTAKLFYGRDIQDGYGQIPPASDGTALVGFGYRLDLTGLTVTIGWTVMGCGSYVLRTYPSWELKGCDMLDRAVDIYFNGATTPTFSYDPSKLSWISETGVRFLGAVGVFDVEHTLDYELRDVVPFDLYTFRASVFVIDKATNKSVPIVAFAAGYGPDYFVVSSTSEPMENWFTYDNGTGPNTVGVMSSMATVEIKRSQLSKAFVMCMFIVNWALTITSVYITLLVLVGVAKRDPTILVFPATLVLTIPTLRNLYVGSPPFGIYIDTFGFFLQMMIVAASSMTLLCQVALLEPAPTREASGGDEKA